MCLGVKNDLFSMVGGLGGDFYQDIYETKLFGIHSRSVSSCLNAGKCRPQNVEFTCFLGRKWVCMGGSKMRVLSMFGGLGGDFYKDIYEAKLFGMHIGSVLSGYGCRKCEN